MNGKFSIKNGRISSDVQDKFHGYIQCKDYPDNIYFSISDVVDKDIAPPVRGEYVSFIEGKNEKGVAAKNIHRQWQYGIIETINIDTQSGTIKSAINNDQIPFNFSDLVQGETVGINKKDKVVFSSIRTIERNYIAKNVIDFDYFRDVVKSDGFYGIISYSDKEKGWGLIISPDTLGKIRFRHQDAIGFDHSPFKNDEVVFFQQNISDAEKSIAAQYIVKIGHISGKISYDFQGVIKNLNEDENYGFVKTGFQLDDLYFRYSDMNPLGNETFAIGDYVKFWITEINDSKCPFCFRKIPHFVGKINSWDTDKREGTILPECSGKQILFNGQDIYRKKDREQICEGTRVSFLLLQSDDERAVCIRKEYPLRVFASLGNEEEMLRGLESKALPETWDYKNTKGSRPRQILWNYLFRTFERLEVEEEDLENQNQKKILIAKSDDNKFFAIFNTGLVSQSYQRLYAVFTENQPLVCGKPRWNLKGFLTEEEDIDKDHSFTVFASPPNRAKYFDLYKPQTYVFDPDKTIYPKYRHILQDRDFRLPKALLASIPPTMKKPEEIENFLISFLKAAISWAQERSRWNYKTAIPQYFPTTKTIQLLLPICLTDPRKVDVALAVEFKDQGYRAFTILDLDSAYNNARLVARPESEWLSANVISQTTMDEADIDE